MNEVAHDMWLDKFPKSITSPFQYRQLFANIREFLADHQFLYIDGSKLNSSVSCSFATDNRVIKIVKLYELSSNFSAEIIGIYEACLYVSKQKGKYLICNDSLSTIKSVLNISNTNFLHLQLEPFWSIDLLIRNSFGSLIIVEL